MLSIIGILFNDFKQDELGPSLIVGSGAFNLLIISAISAAVIPTGETRRIQTYPVFIVTMIFSLFSYIWLLIILSISSPNRVEVWEAAVTLAFIPVIILCSYAAEKGWLDLLFCQGTDNKVTARILTRSGQDWSKKSNCKGVVLTFYV